MAKKARGEYLCGVHAVLAALERGPERVIHVCLAQGRGGKPAEMARQLAEKKRVPLFDCPADHLDDRAGTLQHQGMLAKVHPTKLLDMGGLLDLQVTDLQVTEKKTLLLLDGVQDPRNLGAILRTAAALGAGGVVWPKDGAAGLTPIVAKAAAGALETLPLAQVTNLSRAVEEAKKAGYWAVAADPEGETILGADEIPRPVALVLGGEGRGVRRLVREKCDLGVRIPLGGGPVTSLNVGVAAAIFLHAMRA